MEIFKLKIWCRNGEFGFEIGCVWVALFVFAFLFLVTGGAFARERPPVDRKTFNAVMDRAYPNGRGPNSTSRARGFYKGADGNWKVRR